MFVNDTPAYPIFPVDPLDTLSAESDAEYRRRAILGVLESYNGNYDMLAEALQNALDAVEDAKIGGLPPPYRIDIEVNLAENSFSVLDTGVGMSPNQIRRAFAPHVSFKHDHAMQERRARHAAYRGYKGVGLTFLAYGTDDIVLHSKNNDGLTKGRMQYGRAWAEGKRADAALVVEDVQPSPLEQEERGTYLRLLFSTDTRPKRLYLLGATSPIWEAVLRTKTALGQVLLDQDEVVPIEVSLKLVDSAGAVFATRITPSFLYPHEVKRKPPLRFLNLPEYHNVYAEYTEPPAEKLRQDGLYLTWDKVRIAEELSADHREQFRKEIETYSPCLYAFLPYQGSVWGELNELSTGMKNRNYLYPGLMIAVNRQRVADVFEIEATRYETFSRNVLVLIHFDDAKPDQGRKTLQHEVMDLARRAADRAVQYLATQRALLRPPGESPTPEQRQVERNHEEWKLNVQMQARTSPLHVPPVAYVSTPLTEQDVVGLFHQLAALEVFPGIKVYATSQSETYDCLVDYDCLSDTPGLLYVSRQESPLGVSRFVLGDGPRFQTRGLTLEFKNNLDALVADVDGPSSKSYKHIDICVCWSTNSLKFKGYELEEIKTASIDKRQYPGATHTLHRDGDTHIIQVVMLKLVTEMIQAGAINLRSAPRDS